MEQTESAESVAFPLHFIINQCHSKTLFGFTLGILGFAKEDGRDAWDASVAIDLAQVPRTLIKYLELQGMG